MFIVCDRWGRHWLRKAPTIRGDPSENSNHISSYPNVLVEFAFVSDADTPCAVEQAQALLEMLHCICVASLTSQLETFTAPIWAQETQWSGSFAIAPKRSKHGPATITIRQGQPMHFSSLADLAELISQHVLRGTLWNATHPQPAFRIKSDRVKKKT